MPTIHLLRHGQSKGNATRGIIQGSGPEPGNTLDPVGVSQASRLGLKLWSLGIKPDAAWSSPLTRARQTADIALAKAGYDLPVIEDDRLREMCKGLANLPGGMEGRRRETVETPEYWEQFALEGWQYRHGSQESGGETAKEVSIRGLEAMNDIADALGRYGTGLVFAHAQLQRYTVGAIRGWPDIREINTQYMVANGDGFTLIREAGLWQITGRIVCTA